MEQILLQRHHLAQLNAMMQDMPMRFGLPLQQVLTQARDEMRAALNEQQGGEGREQSAEVARASTE